MAPTPLSRLALLVLVAIVPACAPDDGDVAGDDFRIINGTDVMVRNGAVQMKVPKKKETITDPKKAHLYCTGALISEDCVITAGHCIANVGEDNHVAGAVWWHPAKTNNGDNGRPVPEDGEVVAKVKAVKMLGREHRDLAVVKLDKKLPGPFLSLAKDTPALETKIHILGNGTIEKDEYAHREADMTLTTTSEDAADRGYVSLELARIGNNGGMTAPGDSGGPALVDGKIVGLGSRSATKNVSAYYASTTAAKSRPWLVAQIKAVCGLDIDDPGTTGEDGGTGDASESGGSDTSEGDTLTSGGDTSSTGDPTWGDSDPNGGADDPSWGDDDPSWGEYDTSSGDDASTDDGPTWDLGSGWSYDDGNDTHDSWDDGGTWDLGGGVHEDEPMPLPVPGMD